MSRDEITTAYDEWHKDAMRDVTKMPNRWEAFYAGWQACMEWYFLNGGQDNDKVFSEEELAGRTDF